MGLCRTFFKVVSLKFKTANTKNKKMMPKMKTTTTSTNKLTGSNCCALRPFSRVCVSVSERECGPRLATIAKMYTNVQYLCCDLL